jgi:hypothetical protein
MGTMVRLPDPLDLAVKSLSASHGRWHAAREREGRRLRVFESEFPGLVGPGEPGSGAQFLEYHRVLMRAFEPMVRESGAAEVALRPWREVPYWLSQFFAWAQPGYLTGALGHLQDIVRAGSPDDLGRFLESPPTAEHPFRGLHDVSHTMIAIYERHRFGADHPGLEGAGMGSPETSPHNAHFWGLHGWIDELYERILSRRGRN